MKLPEIFKNKINTSNNNKEVFIGEFSENEDIFAKLPVNVKITTKKDELVITTIIGKTKNYLITKNRNVIYINDIKQIEKT